MLNPLLSSGSASAPTPALPITQRGASKSCCRGNGRQPDSRTSRLPNRRGKGAPSLQNSTIPKAATPRVSPGAYRTPSRRRGAAGHLGTVELAARRSLSQPEGIGLRCPDGAAHRSFERWMWVKAVLFASPLPPTLTLLSVGQPRLLRQRITVG